jgi:uncharacterized protein (TIGR02270 family)
VATDLPVTGGTTDGETILWEVADDHLDEAEFLTEQWLLAARSPRFNPEVLRETLEARLEAHLDGLVVGGDVVATQLLWSAIGEGTIGFAGRFAACGLALLADRARPTVDPLLEALTTARKPKVRDGLQKALVMTDRRDIDEPVRLALYAAESPEVQATLLAILAARRIDPGPILSAMLADARPAVVRGAAAQAAAATTARGALYPVIESLLTSDEAAVRGAALRTGLIWNLISAWRSCAAQAAAGRADAMLYLAMLDGPAAVPLLTTALSSPERRADALFALGFTGLRDAADACLPWLDDPELPVARLAGEAVAAITGIPLDDPQFGAPRPTTAQSALPALADDLREELMPTPVDALPVPIAVNVRRWWSERRAAFAGGQRYLRGRPFTRDTLQADLRTGPLRRSGPLACEIAIRSGGDIQLAALRLRYPDPDLPSRLESALHRAPRWR